MENVLIAREHEFFIALSYFTKIPPVHLPGSLAWTFAKRTAEAFLDGISGLNVVC